MPQWLAYLTPWMDDDGTEDAWLPMVKRYAAVAGRWHVLSNETWRRLDYTARRIAVEDCLPLAGDSAPTVNGALVLLRLAEQGAHVLKSEWAAARDAAWAYAADAAWAAAGAAGAAGAARASAADRITAAILTAIEQACDAAEMDQNNG
jgi:hypothetical protein